MKVWNEISYHFMKFVYTYGILKIWNATTTHHQRSVQVMYELERYKIIRQNNVDFLMIQGRFPIGLYKKKINTKTSMSSLLFVEFNKLQKLMIIQHYGLSLILKSIYSID